MSKGNGRANIPHAAKHTASILRGGKRHPQFNPHYEVRDQNEPTAAHPISQHKQFKGHSTHGGGTGRIPK